MIYGVSYYPEQKSGTELEHDLKLLIASGLDFVRMGEFAWCRFEKTAGVFDFKWLDIVVDRLGQHGMKSIICTPTACPPVWMVEKYPDMMYHKYGRGKAYYIGTGFTASGMAGTIVDGLLENNMAKIPFAWNGCVECVRRDSQNRTLYLLFNFEKEVNPIHCEKPMKDVLTGKPVEREILLQPKGWTILTG